MLKVKKNSFPQGKVYQLVIQYHIVSLENIYTSKILHTEHAGYTWEYLGGHAFEREQGRVYERS